ncbi:MAG TPA: hypothetical protein VFI37_16685 [Gaiellaceae bacterium]|nr:hypothetical protein [Gaiellaceae bacterium]
MLVLFGLALLEAGCGGGGGRTTRSVTTPTAPGRGLVVGAVEDAARHAADEAGARAATGRARSAGFGALAFSAIWTPGLDRLPDDLLAGLRRAVDAAAADGIEPIVAVYQFSGDTPLTEEAQTQFAAFAASVPRLLPRVRHVIVGNEPNTNLFWMPQFDGSGGDAAAASYEQLLARSYDAIKAVSPDVEVIGGGLAPRGADRPAGARPTHSPTAFIRDLGAAYRASGRQLPLLDAFSIHVYGESSRIPPSFPHPKVTTIGIADYDKLAGLLHEAFGRDVPIVYGEYGADTTVPPGKAEAYTGAEARSTHPVDARTQGDYYVHAIRLAACQPLVEMLLFFHVVDEPQLERLQTGVYWADGTPKPDLEEVAAAARAAESGEVQCSS